MKKKLEPSINIVELQSALESMVWQFAYHGLSHGRKSRRISTGGMSALEEAFYVLGWPDPMTVLRKGNADTSACFVKGCAGWVEASGPWITDCEYYVCLCSEHFEAAHRGRLHESDLRMGSVLALRRLQQRTARVLARPRRVNE